jgi:hypothetical protein
MDVKKIYHKKFLITYISYILLIVATATVAILSYAWISSQWVYLFIFSLLFMLVVMSYRFKKKMYLIIHQSYIENIQADVIDPIELSNDVNMITIQKKLIKEGFQLHYTDHHYVVLTKIEKDDHIRKVFQHHILYVSVIMFSDEGKYYQEHVDTVINNIQFHSQTQEKKRIDRLLITQYKPVTQFNDQERELINEIIFIKTDRHIVSTINIGIVEDPKIALMLVAKTYKPSSYYDVHRQLIYTSLK